ncbi:twin-arginine translocation signal domain-containing protein, partial [Rhodanobacter sp. 115]|uniref:twin-arginine translocation signal domain-containing protein n=1 Tax=Rhodanobacter sp. FW021-MT20 TaxID=1162282 RepID=UPI000261042A
MTHKNTPDKSRPDKSRPDKSTIDKQPSVPTVESADAPADPGRRRLLGGMALAGAALATTGCQPQSSTKPAAGKPAIGGRLRPA